MHKRRLDQRPVTTKMSMGQWAGSPAGANLLGDAHAPIDLHGGGRLQRSIFGRNCGASFCSMIVAPPRRGRPRSMASVNPVGPASDDENLCVHTF